MSVTTKSAAYLIFKSKTKFHRILYGIFKVFIVWLLLKTLRLRVLASFTGHRRQTAMTSFQLEDSHRSNKTTGSSLIVAHWQINFLAICA
jgi:hypothetical protein